MSGAVSPSEGEKLVMIKFNLWSSEISSGEDPTSVSTTAVGPVAVPEETPEPSENMSRVAPSGGGAGPRYTYQSLSITTNNFEKRLGGGLSMTGQTCTEMEVLSQVQHVNIVPLLGSSKDGMAPCLVYVLIPSRVQRQCCLGAADGQREDCCVV